MAKYKCKVCGYVHEGNKAPDTCPVCSAPASEFEEIKEEGAAKKGINRDSNVYTVVYAAVMVVLVAGGCRIGVYFTIIEKFSETERG